MRRYHVREFQHSLRAHGGTRSMSERTSVDARGQPCPYPVLALRNALAALPAGAEVELLADDPLSPVDVAAYCLRSRHVLVFESTDHTGYRCIVRRT